MRYYTYNIGSTCKSFDRIKYLVCILGEKLKNEINLFYFFALKKLVRTVLCSALAYS